MANQDLFFDITKQGSEQEKQQYLITRVGDGGLKTVTITVWSNGYPYNLTGLTPVFEGVKPDGERIIDTTGAIVLDPKKGVFRYTFPQQASTAEGQYKQAFFKLKRDEQTDSSLEVKINVLKNKVEFGINSESYYTEYQQEINKFKTKINEEVLRLNDLLGGINTQIEVDTTLMNSLHQGFNNLKESINENGLVTKSEVDTTINNVNNKVDTVVRTIDTVKQEVKTKIDDLDKSKMDVKVITGVLDDVANITKTGHYYYNENTLNLPTRNPGNSNGFIQAIMQDDNNGMITVLGTGLSREKYKGKLYSRWKTSIPILLWEGSATKNNLIHLRGNVHQFGLLIINVTFVSDRHSTKFVTIPANGTTLYLNQTGMRSSEGHMKNGYLEEIEILIKDDTHLEVTKTQIASDGNAATDSNATITAIYGIY